MIARFTYLPALPAQVALSANNPFKALEVLQGAESAARARARVAFQNFLALWKNADTDIPILKRARAEYAKVQ